MNKKLKAIHSDIEKTEIEIDGIKTLMDSFGNEWSERYEELEVELCSLSDYYNDLVVMYNREYDKTNMFFK